MKVRFQSPAQPAAMSSFAILVTFVASIMAEEKAPHVTAFPEATIIEGSARERGEQYGKLFRDAIHRFLKQEIYGAFENKPFTREQMLQYAAACGQVVRQECPLIAREFEGVAAGADLTFDEVMLINLHEELYHRAELPTQGHCTAVAVSAADSGNGHTYVGQTWDWMPSVVGQARIVEWRRTEASSVLAYGFPGMPMGAGVNGNGIALCWTSAALGTTGVSPRIGIPSYVLIAHLLAQRDLEAVIREAQKDKHAGWFTFLMADGHGNLLNIEGSPQGIVIERGELRMARVGYGSRLQTGAPADQPIPLHPRCQTMYKLLTQTAGKNHLERLQDYFADPAYRINMGKSTIDMMVFDTTARAVYVSRGSSYHLEWRKFTFTVAGDVWNERAMVIKPTADELRWLRIPWMTDLAEAQHVAERERRPIFLWVAGDDPLGRC